MRRLILTAIVAAVALGATGCIRVNATMGSEIPQDRVAQIVPGQTTKADILRWFGAPAEYTDGEIFARLSDLGEYAYEDLAALPFSDLLVYEIYDGQWRGLILILFNWSQFQIHRDRLVVFFDENDVVLYYGITRQREHPQAAAVEPTADEAAPPAPAAQAAPAEPVPPPPEPPPVGEYTVMRGDSLSSIAKAHYGDPNQFPRIVEANPGLREAPNRLVPGQVLRIPR